MDASHDGATRDDMIRRELSRYLDGEMTGDQEATFVEAMYRAGELQQVIDAVWAHAAAEAAERRVVRLDLLATWGGSFVVAAAGSPLPRVRDVRGSGVGALMDTLNEGRSMGTSSRKASVTNEDVGRANAAALKCRDDALDALRRARVFAHEIAATPVEAERPVLRAAMDRYVTITERAARDAVAEASKVPQYFTSTTTGADGRKRSTPLERAGYRYAREARDAAAKAVALRVESRRTVRP